MNNGPVYIRINQDDLAGREWGFRLQIGDDQLNAMVIEIREIIERHRARSESDAP